MNRSNAIKAIMSAIPLIAFGKFKTSKSVQDQAMVKEFARDYGKPFNLDLTMQAIAWQESSYGVNQRNSADLGGGSFGYFGITIEFAVEEMRWLNDQDVDYIIDFITQPAINAFLCVRKLIRSGAHRRDWLIVWKRYNGNNPQYALDIQNKIKIIKMNGE